MRGMDVDVDDFNFDIAPQTLDAVLPPPDYNRSRDTPIYRGKDPRYVAYLSSQNTQAAAAEDLTASSYGQIATLSSDLANDSSMPLPDEILGHNKFGKEQRVDKATKKESTKQRAERTRREREMDFQKGEAGDLEMDNAAHDMDKMQLDDWADGEKDVSVSPQKKRLTGREEKKAAYREKKERYKEEHKAKKLRSQRTHEHMPEYDELGGQKAETLKYDAELVEEVENLDETLARNIADMQLMSLTEAGPQKGNGVMDMDTGKTSGLKRERSL